MKYTVTFTTSEIIYYDFYKTNMMNVNTILCIFNNLVHQKYPEPTQDEPSSKDYELADQLFRCLTNC